ncbi:hypothetical protein ULF88_08190 [Halopseudomonas pachastrellae]|nr:hypothetical protein [Halopseudomonas pachastrellae]
MPWHNAYPGTRMGGKKHFTLCHSGHIQGLLCPPGHPRAHYHSGPAVSDNAESWLATAEAQQGSWWPAWSNWLKDHSGPLVKAPANEDGGLGAAPGRYVNSTEEHDENPRPNPAVYP